MPLLLQQIPFGIDPEKVFTHCYKDQPYAFWLDGNRIIPGLSRYSFMGANPRFLVSTRKGKTEIVYPTHTDLTDRNPFDVVRQILDDYPLPPSLHQSIPFVAGLVGYFGYEMNQYVEAVPVRSFDPTEAPEAFWMFVDQVLIYDQVEKKAYLSRLVADSSELDSARAECEKRLRQISEASALSIPEPDLAPVDLPSYQHWFEQRETYASYISKIKEIQEHIARGDIYQACFTHQITASLGQDPFELYRVLRRINPAPFSGYVRMKDLHIVSSSPERFLKCSAGGIVESRPIKGTRPRSASADEDQQLRRELQTSEKDRAENLMIVDLVRNDLGRVCETGHVRVPALMRVESYATVHQLVSIVEGELRSGQRPLDAVKAAFPGGSMTGAPKIRAMEILHGLEPVARGIYSGGLGYLDLRGGLDLSMVIRTLICRGGKAYFHVGGGIVADSDPEKEYQETMDKAFALKQAIVRAHLQASSVPRT
ncbi:aminodeoxychorismate synthase component I [Lihuaxuella thermophila]|uniref:aminodeoxychorismate synthase n=1 Tax=Lihuaxuella thermophila TaxID=1173111 RepID=A0A1H8IYA6_9BACL|nr:aminodeoxychorismate synthase component I [Lihuaxuella thermophila]SEN73431.1 para-aminobenzoate synthetase component 1 [Lihuaxuella thermophila]